jgi:metal-dependent amidase/aminoacylase/carboxypeptidase family protein
MLRGGAFDGVHAAMMAHPGPADFDYLMPETLSVAQFEVSYNGKTSHASVAPHLGVNAADAMTVAQVAIGLLRQQFKPDHQVHGVVREAGGAANAIPSAAKGEFFVRAKNTREVIALRNRVLKCFDAGAVASGCSCEVEHIGQPYSDMRLDPWLSHAYKINAEALGRRFETPPGAPKGSTDMANVSHALPAIHPIFGLNTLPAFLHQPEFTHHTNTAAAHEAMLQVAKALAFTAIDAACDEATRVRLLHGSVGSKHN